MIYTSYNISGAQQKSIAIDLYTPVQENNLALVLFVHGFKGFKDWGTHHLTARYFVEHGFQFLKFNFSHNGISLNETDKFDELESFSENSFTKELTDLNTLLDFALSGKEFAAPKSIYLIGHSRGGGISIIQAACDHRVDKLVIWASLNNFNNLWKPEQEDGWRKEGRIYTFNSRTQQNMPLNISLLNDLEQHAALLNIQQAATQIAQPWLIIHGDADTVVPVRQAEELHTANPSSKLLIIEQANHVFEAKHPWKQDQMPIKLKEVCDKTIEFLNG